MIDGKIYKVFVSSTYEDLRAEIRGSARAFEVELSAHRHGIIPGRRRGHMGFYQVSN